MALILRRPWNTQPQGPAEAIKGYGLRHLWSAGSGAVDLASGGLASLQGGARLSPIVGEMAYVLDGTDDYLSLSSPTKINALTGSVSLLFRFATTLDAARSIFAFSDGTTSNLFAVFIGDGATSAVANELITITRVVGGTTTFTLAFTSGTRSILFDGLPHTILLSSNGSAWSIAVDGIDRAVSIAAGSNNGAFGNVTGITNAYLGARGYATLVPFSGSIRTAAIFAADMKPHAKVLHDNPWPLLFEPRRIFIPATAGGATTFTITPSGAIAFSSTSDQIHTRIQSPSGNILFSGGTSPAHEKQYSPSGSVVFSGTAPVVNTNIYQITPTGEIVFSGTPDQIHEKLISVGGTLTFNGSAGVIFIPAGGVVGSDYQRISIGLGRAGRLG